MKKGIFSIITLISILICVFVQLFVAHKLSTAGIELTNMETERVSLDRENESLRHAIASDSSLLTVAARAKMMGFTDASFHHIETPPMALVLE